ncbi:hypothetical protein AKJ16_DCAP02407 [Drosera capensis]
MIESSLPLMTSVVNPRAGLSGIVSSSEHGLSSQLDDFRWNDPCIFIWEIEALCKVIRVHLNDLRSCHSRHLSTFEAQCFSRREMKLSETSLELVVCTKQQSDLTKTIVVVVVGCAARGLIVREGTAETSLRLVVCIEQQCVLNLHSNAYKYLTLGAEKTPVEVICILQQSAQGGGERFNGSSQSLKFREDVVLNYFKFGFKESKLGLIDAKDLIKLLPCGLEFLLSGLQFLTSIAIDGFSSTNTEGSILLLVNGMIAMVVGSATVVPIVRNGAGEVNCIALLNLLQEPLANSRDYYIELSKAFVFGLPFCFEPFYKRRQLFNEIVKGFLVPFVHFIDVLFELLEPTPENPRFNDHYLRGWFWYRGDSLWNGGWKCLSYKMRCWSFYSYKAAEARNILIASNLATGAKMILELVICIVQQSVLILVLSHSRPQIFNLTEHQTSDPTSATIFAILQSAIT